MATKQVFWMEEIIADTHMAALQQMPLDVVAWLMKDIKMYGVGYGLVVSQSSPASPSIKITAGRVWLGTGLHGETTVDTNIDLTDYIPVNPGDYRVIHVLAGVGTQSSVPVVIPSGDTINSVVKDVVSFSIVTVATQAGPFGAMPNLIHNTDTQILLAEITLHQGMGIILDANIDMSRKGLVPDIRTLSSRVSGVEQDLLSKSPVGHHHAIGDVDGLQNYLDTHTQSMSSIIGLLDALTAINTAIGERALTSHNHNTVYHSKVGDEVHTGGFQVTKPPTAPQDIVRLQDIAGFGNGSVSIGAGSTIDSGYAYVGGLTMAWGRGASTWFSGATNPIVDILLPISFDAVLNYAITTENTESNAASYDNDAWFQMCQNFGGTGYGTNRFQTIAQCRGGEVSGWIRPMLVVWGITAPHDLLISNPDLSIMEANGQVYPKLISYQLTCVNNIGPVTWSITGTSSGISVTSGPDATGVMQLSIAALGAHTITAHVVDSQGHQATKTITITVTAYTVVTMVITTGDWAETADIYPWGVSSPYLTKTGGQDPITWSIQPGSGGTATTLPSAAISTVAGGKVVTGSVNTDGTYWVNVRAVDSAGSPQTVDKAIRVDVTTWVDPNPPYCFEASETFILMEDGAGKLLKDVRAGDKVLTTTSGQHERGGRGLQPALVTDVMLVPATGGEEDSVVFQGIKATPGHAMGSVTTLSGGIGEWTHSRDLKVGSILVSANQGKIQYATLSKVERSTPVKVAGTLGTAANSYYVGPTVDGPWFLAHNISY